MIISRHLAKIVLPRRVTSSVLLNSIFLMLLGVFLSPAILAQNTERASADPASAGTPSDNSKSSDSKTESGAKQTVLQEITVTATRFPEDVKDVPQSMTMITEETLEQNHSVAPNQMVREAPGIFSPLAAAQGTPIIRGENGNRVLYLWDQIPLNNGALFSGPNANLNQIPLVAVDRMEIIRGPGAVQYGSGAVGGVINILTPRAPFTDSWSVGGLLQGDYGTVNGERTTSSSMWIASKRLSLEGGFTTQDVGNYSTPAGVEQNTGFNADGGFIDMDAVITTNQLLRFTWIQDRRGDIAYYASSDLNANGTPRNFNAFEIRGLAKVDYSIDNFLHHGNGLNLYLYKEYYNQGRDTITVSPNTQAWTAQSTTFATTPQDIYGGGLQDTIRLNLFRIIFGADRRAEDLTSNKTLFTLARATGSTVQSTPLGNVPPGTYHVTDGYILATATPLPRLSVSIGGRIESSHIHSDPRTQDVLTPYFTAADLTLVRTWNAETWSVGAVYSIRGGWVLAGSIASSFRAPTFSDALNTGTPVFSSSTISVPNKNVGPERSVTYELGPRYNGKDLKFSVVAYTNQLSHAIVTVNAPYQVCINNNTTCYQATYGSNADAGFVRGIEASLSKRFFRVWTFTGNITYTHGTDTTQNTPFRFITPTNGTLALQYTSSNDKWWTAASVILVDRLRNPAIKLGDQNDVSFTVNPALGSPSATNPPLYANFQLPGYAVTNWRGGYKIWKREKAALDLTADIQNLFNVKYREPYSQQEWLAPGIGATLGGRITF